MDVVLPILEKAVASFIINKLIDKATNYVQDKYYWKTDLQEELQNFRCLLPQIEEVLVFAEDRLTSYGSSNPELIKWLLQFRGVIDEVEEELDELEYLELEKKFDSDIDPSFRPAKRFLKSDDVLERLSTCVKNLKTSASDVEKFRALVMQTAGIGTRQMQQEIILLTDQSRITSCLPVSFKGHEEEKGKIIQYLLGESVEESKIQSSENVHCLPLIGMGGMGKTVLAQQVFDYFENVKKEHFDIKIWVCDSSTDLNASSLMKKILEYSTCQSESGPLELIPVKLKEELHSKRFLLVLDDVWDDKNLTAWEKLSAPLRYGQQGSWMVLTTRLRSVAKMVSKVIRGTMEPITLQDLSKDKCHSLLCEPASADRDPNKYSPLLEIGKGIVEKLDGVQEDAFHSVVDVGKLTSLQELCFTVDIEPGYKIDELMNMDNLRQLSIAKLSNVQSLEEVNRVNLARKSYLTSLKLNWDGVSSNPDLDQQEVLAALQPPHTIRELFITHYKGGRPAPWMDTQSLSQLVSLELHACASLEELPPLWKLPCLKFLKLNQMKAIRSLGCHFSGQIDIQFPVLEELRFYDHPLWEEWNSADDYIWFPHLITFEIKNCPKLKKIPDLPLSKVRIRSSSTVLQVF